MATTVCLRLSTPKPHFSSCSRSLELTLKPREPVSGTGGWSFLQTLSVTRDREEIYVHPLLKSRLSDHSLRMCTEHLGSETGSDNMVAGEENLFSMSSCSKSESPRKEKRKKSEKQSNNSPPPLTTISSLECLKIKARREGGMMVMEAVKGPSDRSCFRTERSHGRLQLYVYPKMDHQPKQFEREDNDGQRVESENNKMENKQEKFKKEDEETEHGVEEGEESTEGSDNVANNIKVGGKLGIGDYRPMPTSCKQVSGCRGRFFGFGLNLKIEPLIPS